jgi:hypothetical protein
MHLNGQSMGFKKACSKGDKNKNEQKDGKRNAKSERSDCFFGLLLIFVFDQIKKRGTETDDNQDESNDDDGILDDSAARANRLK